MNKNHRKKKGRGPLPPSALRLVYRTRRAEQVSAAPVAKNSHIITVCAEQTGLFFPRQGGRLAGVVVNDCRLPH